jgi:shikimate dehydrogenase
LGERAPARIDGNASTVGVIGWPVEHSLSPVIHNAAYAALSMEWVYVPLPVEAGRLPDALAGLVALGFRGANVTMPHKTEAAALADERTEDATRLNAVNTLVVAPSGLVGHNTDAPGFDHFLRQDAGFDPQGRTALIFGAGGAARACALALARAGLARLSIAVRDASRAEDIRTMLAGEGTSVDVVAFDAASAVAADLVVNATPLGVHGEELPHPALGPKTLVVDLLYRPVLTPMQSAGRAAGSSVFGGLGLLLHQAALSFELFTGRPAPLDVMSAAALAELA